MSDLIEERPELQIVAGGKPQPEKDLGAAIGRRKPKKRARNEVRKARRRKLADPLAVARTIRGIAVPEKVWIPKARVEELRRACSGAADRARCQIMLDYWPESGGDAWYTRKGDKVEWRDVEPGECSELRMPPDIEDLWATRKPRAGLPYPVYGPNGWETQSLVSKKFQLTAAQDRMFKRECQAIGLKEAEAVRYALAQVGFIPEFDLKL